MEMEDYSRDELSVIQSLLDAYHHSPHTEGGITEIYISCPLPTQEQKQALEALIARCVIELAAREGVPPMLRFSRRFEDLSKLIEEGRITEGNRQ